MNIDDLPAGPEIDALVAERVMGWMLLSSGHGRTSLPEVYFDPKNREKCWRENGKRRWQAWCPSEDVAAAFEVFEELRQSGDWCCLVIASDYSYLWTVRLTPDMADCGMGPHEPTIVTEDESAPLCICRAALLAVEEKT